jgi:hypothetical protein
VVLWLTIVQPDGFSHFAPTYDLPVKQPNLDDQSFIHGGKSDRSSGSRVVSNTQDERLLSQHCCPYSVLLTDPPPTSHPAETFNATSFTAEILPEKSRVKLQALQRMKNWELFQEIAPNDARLVSRNLKKIQETLQIHVGAVGADPGFDSQSNQQWLKEQKTYNGICPGP